MSKSTGKKKTQKKTILWAAVVAGGLLLVGIIISIVIAVGGSKEIVEEQGEQQEQREPVYANIEIENYGTITIFLDAESAPVTVDNFVSLAESGFYDGLTFHRIIEGFMMQGGDPNGDGTGGSGTTITGEFSTNGWYANTLSHTRGTVSMARSKANNSASSQFFIVQQDSTYLDGSYAAFGYVTSGMDIVDQICADAEPIDGNGLIAVDAQPVIVSITILHINNS